MKRRSVGFVPGARDDVRDALAWWRENRPKAPGALAEELKASIALIRTFPQAGQLVEGQRGGPVHRVLLRPVRYMLYYRSEGDRITVLVLWHANRGRAPDL